MHSADCFSGIGKGGLYPPIVRTVLTIIAAPEGVFVVRAEEKLTAFVELERQVLTVTFYLESIQADSCK